MSTVITAQMMNDLAYTCENQPPVQKIRNSNNTTYEFKIFDYIIKNHDASAILNKIKENLDELATIESKENHVPLVRAKEAFSRAFDLQLIDKDLIQEATIPFPHPIWATRCWTISSLMERIMPYVICKYSNVAVNVDSRREKLVIYLAKILEWELSAISHFKSHKSQVSYADSEFSMFLFRSSDLEAATDYLNQAIGDPSGMSRVREVYVQESALDSFKAILQRKLRCYSSEVINDPLLRQSHDETEKILKKLNASTFRPLNVSEGEVVPVVCYEFDKSFFPPDSPVTVMKVFRTAKEAVSLARKDKIRRASIWTGNFALAYELVNSLDCRYFWINCLGVGCKMWTEFLMLETQYGNDQAVAKLGSSGVRIENSYHFEYFHVNDLLKFVAFPFGVSFAN